MVTKKEDSAETTKVKDIVLGGDDERERAVTIRVKESNPTKFAEAVTAGVKQAIKDHGAKSFKATIICFGD